MLGAIVVDFDGTACSADVSEVLLEVFGDPSWPTYDDLVDRGEMGLREAMHRQAALLTGTREEMLAYALANCALDPTFPPFVAWAAERALPLSLASDGFAFYIRPILEEAGLGSLEVTTNEMTFPGGGGPAMEHPNGHQECVGCGTCKMLAVQRARAAHGPVAFVGEGQSDRYGALYADVAFAKDALVAWCERDGVPFLPWTDFDDVRLALESLDGLPGPVAPARCPGWTLPAER
ncbi:MAG: HAD-IB family phosphatase [Actinobacteria bacterium]|nr:HAD-IB family phosphatase [Actinomycetota bacterium]